MHPGFAAPAPEPIPLIGGYEAWYLRNWETNIFPAKAGNILIVTASYWIDSV